MNEMTNNRPAGEPTFRPQLSYYHANAKGTGSAVRFELHPAHDESDGSIFMEIANQATVGGFENGRRTFATFDWKNRIVVKLDIADLANILEVFRGISENIADGKGLFHQTAQSNTVIRLEHRLEPFPGYALKVSRKRPNEELREAFIVFSMSEALGLSAAIEHSLGVIAFGIPQVIPRRMPVAVPVTVTPCDRAVGF